jgi:hypothetical protein
MRLKDKSDLIQRNRHLQAILAAKASYTVGQNETLDGDPLEEMLGPPEMLGSDKRNIAKQTFLKKGLIRPPYFLKKSLQFYQKTLEDPLHE